MKDSSDFCIPTAGFLGAQGNLYHIVIDTYRVRAGGPFFFSFSLFPELLAAALLLSVF